MTDPAFVFVETEDFDPKVYDDGQIPEGAQPIPEGVDTNPGDDDPDEAA